MKNDIVGFESMATPLEAWLSATEEKLQAVNQQESTLVSELEGQLDQIKVRP